MAWTYDETNLDTTTAAGRLNVVRLLIGDTDTNDQLIKNEEVTFALAQANDNVYFAASWSARTISAQFARRVTTKMDGALSANYSDLAKQYKALSDDLREQGQKYSMTSASLKAGGISNAAIDAAQALTDRPSASFSKGQFDNPPNDSQYIRDYD
jgi:hypothetical protein